MPTKQQVIDIHIAHPDWVPTQIAKALGCSPQQILNVKSRYGLKIPRARGRIAKPNNVLALGREAHRAGLTVGDIQRLAESRA